MGQCCEDVLQLLSLCHSWLCGTLALCLWAVWPDAGRSPHPIPLQARYRVVEASGEDSHLWGQLTELPGGDLLWPCLWQPCHLPSS